MTRVSRRGASWAAAATASAAILALVAGCAGGGPAGAGQYTATLRAPSAADYGRDSDTNPDGEDAIVRLDLDDGARMVIWIDPHTIADVEEQHSDPEDPDRWTEPRTIYRAGDGCLDLGAATNGRIVAVALGCYEEDAFRQQAPDQGAALVSTDLATWQVEDGLGEFEADPEVSDDGRVRMVNDVYPDRVLLWNEHDGFTGEP